jgi:hypothetical protein
MVAVALVAILIGVGLEVALRSRRFARLSAYHTKTALEYFHTEMVLGWWPPQFQDLSPVGLGRIRYLYQVRASVHYHNALTEKYERAAR